MTSGPAKVLLPHGLLSGPAAWQPLQRHLGPPVELIAPDVPGVRALRLEVPAYLAGRAG